MKWLGQLWQSFLSVVKILLQSKWHTHLPSSFGNPEELLILANGPSLSRTVQEAPEFIKDAVGSELLCHFPDVRTASAGNLPHSRSFVLDCS